jgi:hypothetical protein
MKDMLTALEDKILALELRVSELETKRKHTKFVKPTVEEITTYCRERKNSVDPNKFFSYYESNGWKVGRNPMKNWKMAIVGQWEHNQYQQKSTPSTVGRNFGG